MMSFRGHFTAIVSTFSSLSKNQNSTHPSDYFYGNEALQKNIFT